MFKRWLAVSSWNPSTFRKWFPRKSARRSRYIFYIGFRVSSFFSGFFFYSYRSSLAILGFLFTTINKTFPQALFIAILKPQTQRATNRKLKLFKIMEIYIYKWKDRIYVGNQFQDLFLKEGIWKLWNKQFPIKCNAEINIVQTLYTVNQRMIKYYVCF